MKNHWEKMNKQTNKQKNKKTSPGSGTIEFQS
jgi:hypothetical protein